MSNASVENLFSTVVHTALPNGAAVSNLFSTVVHTAQPNGAAVENLFSTVVHNVSPGSAAVSNLFSTAVHEGPEFVVPNITGTVGADACFDASVQGLPSSSYHYRWNWQSVPFGSSISNNILPLSDSGSTYPMSGNTGLWHFDYQETSTTTPQGSVGLRDTFGDGWQAGNSLDVSVNGTTVLSGLTLAAGAGPEWYNYAANDGDTVEITFTAGAWSTECFYTLNSGSNGSGVDFYTSPTDPTTPYSFTANGFETSSITTTPDTSGYFPYTLDGTVAGATLTALSYVGENAFEFNGTSDAIALPPAYLMEIAGGNSRTISFWASASSWVDNDVFFSYGVNNNAEDFTLLQKSGPDLQLNLWGGDLRVSANSSTGWNHYFIIYDASETTSYVYQNNDLLGSINRTINTYPSAAFVVGDSPHYWGGGFFEGVIDEFAVWNRALNSCERDVVYNFLQTGSAIAASGSSPNLLEQFCFVPDVTGTYYINLDIVDNENCINLSGTVSALISSVTPPTPPASASCIYPEEVEGELKLTRGLVLNLYKNISKGRERRVDQVPFKLGIKDRLGLRLDDTIFTPSGSTPTYCTGS